MMVSRDRVRGLIIGGAIGDALGMPVETWTPERIFAQYPNGINRYFTPFRHKWFDSETMPAGTTTDDTQLTVATAEAMIAAAHGPDLMAMMAHHHVLALGQSTAGWGKTSVEAIQRIANGVNWQTSGQTTEQNRGTGNGVPMKCAPLALGLKGKYGTVKSTVLENLVNYSAMTHYSQISAEACIIHTFACHYCLTEDFNLHDFLKRVCAMEVMINNKSRFDLSHLEMKSQAKISDRLKLLLHRFYQGRLPHLKVDNIQQMCGYGSCYVFDSMPFAYYFFARNPFSLKTICEVAQAGGDTDTNAKMVGEMIGAHMGFDYFMSPENRWSVDGLRNADKLISLADRLYATFCSKNKSLFE